VGETANSWEYCRQWIDRVEPFFVCILGQRYGHRPDPRELRERVEQLGLEFFDVDLRWHVLNVELRMLSWIADLSAVALGVVDGPNEEWGLTKRVVPSAVRQRESDRRIPAILPRDPRRALPANVTANTTEPGKHRQTQLPKV